MENREVVKRPYVYQDKNSEGILYKPLSWIVRVEKVLMIEGQRATVVVMCT